MATDTEIKQVLALLKNSYPDWMTRHLDELSLGVYRIFLAQWPGELVLAAALEHLADSETGELPRFPLISDFTRRLTRLSTQQNQSQSGNPIAAHTALQDAIAQVGSYRQPQFEDPLLAQVVEQLGWQNLCRSTNPVADRARFLDAYRDAVHEARLDVARPPEIKALLERWSAQKLITNGAREEAGT